MGLREVLGSSASRGRTRACPSYPPASSAPERAPRAAATKPAEHPPPGVGYPVPGTGHRPGTPGWPLPRHLFVSLLFPHLQRAEALVQLPRV